jgi:hypothetical protein
MSNSDLDLVRARRAEIAKLRTQLDAEDADLDVTERTLARLQASKPPSTAAHEHEEAIKAQPLEARTVRYRRRLRRAKPQLSQRDMITGTLRVQPEIWVKDSATLQQRIKEIHGVEIPKTSLYPYLSDLKGEGTIVRNADGGIALAERIRFVRKEAAE